jgi:hypothetical protein
MRIRPEKNAPGASTIGADDQPATKKSAKRTTGKATAKKSG